MNPNYFTEVLLSMLIALQSFFRERNGEWKRNDECYSMEYGRGMIYSIGSAIVYANFDGMPSHVFNDNDKALIWLPRTIDDSSPEAQKRSLWGMVDWTLPKARAILLHWCTNPHNMKDEYPTEAILRALCAQEGVEI